MPIIHEITDTNIKLLMVTHIGQNGNLSKIWLNFYNYSAGEDVDQHISKMYKSEIDAEDLLTEI